MDTSVDTRGIIPRALEDLFTYINEVGGLTTLSLCKGSMMME